MIEATRMCRRPDSPARRLPWRFLVRGWLVPLGLLAAGWGFGAAPAEAQVAGVSIDAEGVLRAEYSRREADSLTQRRREAFAREQLPADLVSFSEMRQVSLHALEQVLAERPIKLLPADVRYLYGLQRIDYVFVDPDRRDIILAGPAEGYAPDGGGRMVGLTTGRPPLQLDDLLVALRWGAQTGGRGEIGCSIDPEPQRLANLQAWLRQNSTPAPRSVAQARYPQMAEILGRQVISVFGVPEDSHFAQVLVEADFRMKLIALGKEQPGVRGVRSQLSLLTPQGNSLQRWWFVPLYEPIETDAARLSFHLRGQRAQLLSQEEWSDGRGRRSDAPFNRASTEKFAQLFTEHFSELANASPVFAELQNVFDLAVLAALIEREDLRRRLQWPMDLLLDPQRIPVTSYPVPRQVDSLATSVYRARVMLGLVGGVTLTPATVVSRPSERAHASNLEEVRRQALSEAPPAAAADQTEATPRVWWDR